MFESENLSEREVSSGQNLKCKITHGNVFFNYLPFIKILYENIMNSLRIPSISLKFNSIIIVFLKGFKKKEPSASQRFAFLNYRSLFLSGICFMIPPAHFS